MSGVILLKKSYYLLYIYTFFLFFFCVLVYMHKCVDKCRRSSCMWTFTDPHVLLSAHAPTLCMYVCVCVRGRAHVTFKHQIQSQMSSYQPMTNLHLCVGSVLLHMWELALIPQPLHYHPPPEALPERLTDWWENLAWQKSLSDWSPRLTWAPEGPGVPSTAGPKRVHLCWVCPPDTLGQIPQCMDQCSHHHCYVYVCSLPITTS